MKVFRHHHVPCNDETILLPYFFQNLEKEIEPLRGSKEGTTMKTAACDEMPVTPAINSEQSSRHRGILYPTLYDKALKTAELCRKGWGTRL